MTRFAIDPAALLLMVRQERHPHQDHQLVAPNSLRTHALELLLSEVRRGSLDERQALRIHDEMTAQKVRLLGDRVSRRVAWDLAREHDWEDLGAAEYFAVARLQADALVTRDDAMLRLGEGIVPIASLELLYEPE